MLRHTDGKGAWPENPRPPTPAIRPRGPSSLAELEEAWPSPGQGPAGGPGAGRPGSGRDHKGPRVPLPGVDLVLNSLAEEKLQASVRCLAQHGRFLEIGKFDLSNNHPLGEAQPAAGGGGHTGRGAAGAGSAEPLPCAGTGMAIFLKNVTFHGILLDALFDESSTSWREVAALLRAGIRDGVVRPLKCTVFPKAQVEDAFRYMAQGKHIGKVVIQVRGPPGRPGSQPAGGA